MTAPPPIQRFIHEADPDKSSIELLVEIAIQLMIIFIGIIIVHRMITFIPPYSGFKYESLNLTTVVLGFLVIVFSIQSKIGLKANILADRVMDLWDGKSSYIIQEVIKNLINYPEKYIYIPFGYNCFIASKLKEYQLRAFSLPFDWIFSNLQMMEHILSDNFYIFSYKKFIKNNKEKNSTHIKYKELLRSERGGNQIFNHHRN